MNPPRKKFLNRRIWLIAIALFLLVGAIAGWMAVKARVRGDIEAQLKQLDLGRAEIGDVAVSTSGVSARGVRFFRDDDDSPWLSVDRLGIDHSLYELAGGATYYDQIQLQGVNLTIDAEEFQSADIDAEFDLSKLQIPAESVEISDTKITIRQSGKSDLVADGISGRLDVAGEGQSPVSIEAVVENLAGSQWQSSGQLDADQQQLQISLTTEAQQVKTEQWASWPLIPDGLSDMVQADGTVTADLQIAYANKQWKVEGTSQLKQLHVNLPSYDLPLEVTDGQLKFFKDRVEYEDVVFKTPDGGQATGSGQTIFSHWPIVTSFGAESKNVSITTLRQVIPEIPGILTGRGSGPISGVLNVTRELRTTIDLDGDLQATAIGYGSIAGDESSARVEVRELTFDEQQNFESVKGQVAVRSKFAEVPLSKVFETFEIAELQKTLSLKGTGAGTLQLTLPLATANRLETWTAKVQAAADSGEIAGERLQSVSAAVELRDGRLLLAPLQASSQTSPPVDERAVTNQAARDVSATIQWPIVESLKSNPNMSTGRVVIKTQSTDAGWLVRVIERLAESAGGFKKGNQLTIGHQLTGRVNSALELTIPVANPEDVSGWMADATINNSSVQMENQTLDNVQAQLQLSDSTIHVRSLSATGATGDAVTGKGHLDLDSDNDFALNLKSKSVDVTWLREIAADVIASDSIVQLSPQQAKALLARIRELRGQLALDLDVSGGGAQKIADETVEGFQFHVEATSQQLFYSGIEFSELAMKLNADGGQLDLGELKLELDRGQQLNASGKWDLFKNAGDVQLQWQRMPVAKLLTLPLNDAPEDIADARGTGNAGAMFDSTFENQRGLTSSGNVRIWNDAKENDPAQLSAENAGPNNTDLPKVAGEIGIRGFRIGQLEAQAIKFSIATQDDKVQLRDFVSDQGQLELGLAATLDNQSPFAFEINGDLDQIPLSRLFKRKSVLDRQPVSEITGTASGRFRFNGQLAPFDLRTNGRVAVKQPTLNLISAGDVVVDWDHIGNDWKNSKLLIRAFGGTIKVAELTTQPQRVRLDLADIDAQRLTALFELPAKLTGKLEGDASLNDWSLAETRWADLNLKGSSIRIGPKEFGDFRAKADYRKDELAYEISGGLLAGKLTGKGHTRLNLDDLGNVEFPLSVDLRNGTLKAFYTGSNYFRSLRPLAGGLSAKADFKFATNGAPKGEGRFEVTNVSWDRKQITQQVSVRFSFDESQLLLDDVKMNLETGQVLADINMPLSGQSAGQFRVETRHLSLENLSKIFDIEDWEMDGFLDSRIEGRIGERIIGRGIVGFDRASLHKVAGQSAKVPIAFEVSPLAQRGHVELRRSKLRLFGGTVSGTASAEFGTRFDMKTDLQLANVHSGNLIEAVTDFGGFDQGRLTGRLKISGRDIRSPRDFKGSFAGSLDRAAAFELPVLDQVGRLLSTGSLGDRSFESDDIKLTLSRGRLQVDQLNFQNSIAKVAVDGSMFLDGRLDLQVAARVERLNQPTLVDELLGSPLARFSGSPTAFAAQAIEFLSNRVAFLSVGGTINRPNVRVDAGRQVRAEAVRFFLRDSGLIPSAIQAGN